jgi:DNA-binding transcriptional regulator YiaG
LDFEHEASALTPEEFRTIRTKAGLSLDGLARVLRIADKASVHRWEKGQRTISGPITILMEQLNAGELPSRYLDHPNEQRS